MAVTAQIISSVGRGILTRLFNPGTTSWTIPTSVGRILTISGKGGDGVSDTTGNFTQQKCIYVVRVVQSATPITTSSNATWQNVVDFALSITQQAGQFYNSYEYRVDSLNRTSGPHLISGFGVDYSNPWGNGDASSGSRAMYAMAGSPGPNFSPGAIPLNYASLNGLTFGPNDINGNSIPPTTSPMPSLGTFAGSGYAFVAQSVFYYYTISGSAGASSSVLGATLPGGAYSGGVGYASNVTNLSNISVTPGATYSIVNNGNISITITY